MASVSKLTAGIAGVSTELGGLAKQGRDPTTAMEASFIANAVESRKLAVNLGKTGKAIGAFSQEAQSMALELNRSTEATGSAIGQFERMKDVSTKTGIDSAKTMAKLADVSGVNAQVFTDASLQMSKMEGMSKEAGASLLDTMTKAGQATGDANGALAEIPQRMALLQKRSALLRGTFKGIGIAEFSKQIDSTAVSMQKATGVSAETARAFSMGLGGALQDAAQEFKNLTQGEEAGLNVLTGLALTSGDVNTAFEAMKGGPEDFMKMMQGMVKNLGGDKQKISQVMDWVAAKTGKAFGPERATEIVNFLAASTEGTYKQGEAVKDATGALQKYAKEGFSTGYTAAKRIAIAEELFVTKMRNINKTAETFANESVKSFKMLGEEMVELGKDKGPAGQLTRTLVDLDQKGLVGLLPEKLQGTAVALGGLTERLGKTLKGVLNPLNAIESLFVVFGTAMTHAFMQTKKGLPFLERLGQAFESVGEDAVKWLETLPDKIINVFYKITDAVGGFFKKDSAGGASKWGAIFKRWWERIVTAFTRLEPILKEIRKFGEELWAGITTALDPTKNASSEPDGTTGGAIGRWLGEAWLSAKTYWDQKIYPEVKKLWDTFTAGFGGSGDASTTGGQLGIWIRSAFETALKFLEDNIPKVIATALVDVPGAILRAIADGLEKTWYGKALRKAGGMMAWDPFGVRSSGEFKPPDLETVKRLDAEIKNKEAERASPSRTAISDGRSTASTQALNDLASIMAAIDKAQAARDTKQLELLDGMLTALENKMGVTLPRPAGVAARGSSGAVDPRLASSPMNNVPR